jgi:outer membrane receptor for ferrienterochelin and colicin
MKFFLLIFTIVYITSVFAQKTTISGFIKEKKSGESLIGASVFLPDKKTGTVSNLYGYYSITVNAGSSNLVYSFVGYKPIVLTLNVLKDTTININFESNVDLKTVEITAKRSDQIQNTTQMSYAEIPIHQINSLPVILGEKDVMRAIQLLPGVQSGAEGTTGLYVRGGGPDQNLILLDGVPVYNASHLFGFFSIFNTDALNSVELVKGGFPARYGGRLSSVLDIRMKEGNRKEFQTQGSIGLVSARISTEGPIIKDKTSFIVSARRTYIDFLARPIIRNRAAREGDNLTAGYYFYDVNAKINHDLNEKNKLFFSIYHGKDLAYTDFKPSDDDGNNIVGDLGWGNLTAALRLNSVINKKIFANTTATFSRYNFFVNQSITTQISDAGNTGNSTFQYKYNSEIYDWTLKTDFDYYLNDRSSIKFGVGNIYHTFQPGVSAINLSADLNQNSSAGIDTTFGANRIFANEYYAYAEDDIRLTDKININTGLNFSGYKVQNQNFLSLQPRLSLLYRFSRNWSFKSSYANMRQFIHLLANSSIGLPTDLWVSATDKVKPMESNQIAIGFARTFFDEYEFSFESYYKTMRNLIEYKSGASFINAGNNWEDKIEMGDGLAYGLELFLQKKSGKLTGWIGYTLSWTNRTFENINFGKTFPYRYDRRHDIAITFNYKFNDRIDAGLTWVYGTGNAVTLSNEEMIVNPDQNLGFFNPSNQFSSVNFAAERNAFREPHYHRLDAGINFTKSFPKWTRIWRFGVYNLYNRKNPFYLFFDNEDNKRVLKQITLFPLIPSISFEFKF